MFLAKDETGQQVLAVDGQKGVNYFCSVCDSPVILKYGKIKVPHFSHQHIEHCTRYLYKRESLRHLQLKHDLYKELNNYFNIAMEYYLVDIDQIPDLLINHHTALEIQLSRISPDILSSRSRGYYKLGMDVIWLLEDKEIKKEGGLLKLNHFQISAITKGGLYTINEADSLIKRYDIRHHLGFNRFTYRFEEVPYPQILKARQSTVDLGYFKMTRDQMKSLVEKERGQKSVLNPTLSYMYQLNLQVKDLPKFLYFVSPLEKYILNSPLEWKLYIYYHTSHNRFALNDFRRLIKLRVMSDLPDRDFLIDQLLHFYINIFRFSE